MSCRGARGRGVRVAAALALLASTVGVANGNKEALAAPNFITLAFYMAGETPATATLRGCDEGNIAASTPGFQEFMPFLHFGGPRMSGSSARASNWNLLDYTMAQVQAVAFAFAQGFVYCATSGGDTTSIVSLVIATSNDASGVSGANITSHATQWGNMVNALHTQLKAQSWGSRAGAFAGTNIEPGFTWAVTDSLTWINQVRSVVPRTFVSNPTAFCPTSGTYTGSTACGSGWIANDVISVPYAPGSGSLALMQPVPQIYGSSYRERWYRLSDYLSTATPFGRIPFRGVMTQWRACQQIGCSTYYPTTGFDELQNKIWSDPDTTFNIPPAMLDIRWSNLSGSGATP